jgi:hypothetical protein
MHGETFKSRWFVLARVPHATVLIYYDRKCMDEDHILGYIDMRRVSAVKEGNKTVAVDSSRNPMASLLHKMRGLMGASTLDSATRPVIELVTQTRTYTLCPAYVELPQPVTAAAASAPSAVPRAVNPRSSASTSLLLLTNAVIWSLKWCIISAILSSLLTTWSSRNWLCFSTCSFAWPILVKVISCSA